MALPKARKVSKVTRAILAWLIPPAIALIAFLVLVFAVGLACYSLRLPWW